MGGISGNSNRGSQNQFSTSEARNSSVSMSGQDVWGAQQPALQSLYATGQALLGGSGDALGGAQGVAGDARNAWLQQLTPGGNPYFSQSLQGAIDSATRGFTQNVLPALADAGAAAGQYGSPRDQLARGVAAGQFGQDLTNMVGQMATQQYQGDANRALGALGMAPQMQSMQLAPLALAQQLIGGPTVLGSSVGASSGYATSASQGSGNSRGKGFGAYLGE